MRRTMTLRTTSDKLIIALVSLTLAGGAWGAVHTVANVEHTVPARRIARATPGHAAPRVPAGRIAADDGEGGGGEDGGDGNLTAKISPQQAADAATKAQPGAVTKIELENENDKAVYGVHITANNGTKYDVKVDGNTAEVLKIEADDGGE